jgi:predicted transcriptional regulator
MHKANKVQIHVGSLADMGKRFVGADSIKGLAASLERDYKNVHTDVTVLESAGLLLREGRRLSAPWDELSAHVSLTAA